MSNSQDPGQTQRSGSKLFLKVTADDTSIQRVSSSQYKHGKFTVIDQISTHAPICPL